LSAVRRLVRKDDRMKRVFLALIVVAVSTQAVPAQEYSLNVAERDGTTRIATMILGGWAIGNIGAGVPFYMITEGSLRPVS
jgi:hypothetical protein